MDPLHFMTMNGSLQRSAAFLKVQRAALTLGALYDVTVAAGLLLVPAILLEGLRVPPPGEAVYLWLIAALLVALSAVSLLAAYDPMAYVGNVLVAIASRGAAGAALLAAASSSGSLRGFALLGTVNLAFAAAHTVCWRATRHLRAQLL
ncbi:MAG: hypothetical protein AAF560_13570 [Acidobacteriota bacterium]